MSVPVFWIRWPMPAEWQVSWRGWHLSTVQRPSLIMISTPDFWTPSIFTLATPWRIGTTDSRCTSQPRAMARSLILQKHGNHQHHLSPRCKLRFRHMTGHQENKDSEDHRRTRRLGPASPTPDQQDLRILTLDPIPSTLRRAATFRTWCPQMPNTTEHGT